MWRYLGERHDRLPGEEQSCEVCLHLVLLLCVLLHLQQRNRRCEDPFTGRLSDFGPLHRHGRSTDLALQVVDLLHSLSCSGVVDLQHIIPVLKLGLKHLNERERGGKH